MPHNSKTDGTNSPTLLQSSTLALLDDVCDDRMIQKTVSILFDGLPDRNHINLSV
jgi:hypothetical protein